MSGLWKFLSVSRRCRDGFPGSGARAFIALAGYAAALVMTYALVEMRTAWIDPNDVNAAGGMFAFGDLLLGLFLFALFSLPSTIVLIRLLRDSASFWTLVSWASLIWGAVISPLLALVIWFPTVIIVPGSPDGDRFLLIHVLAILNSMASPGILLVMLAAWVICRDCLPARKRLLWASALEALSLCFVAVWWATSLYSAQHP